MADAAAIARGLKGGLIRSGLAHVVNLAHRLFGRLGIGDGEPIGPIAGFPVSRPALATRAVESS